LHTDPPRRAEKRLTPMLKTEMKMSIFNKNNEIIMKSVYIFLLVLIFLSPVFVHSQADRDSADIVMELKVYPNFAIGYANCYKGVVLKVIKGEMPDTLLSLTVVAGDKTRDSIFWENTGKVLEIGFTKYRTDEKYTHTYITGFVDKSRTSWKIIYIRKK
jgi:hypothetical protein